MKYTSKINKSPMTRPQQDTSGDRKGVFMDPPEYRIEFADNSSGFAKDEPQDSAPEIRPGRMAASICTSCTQPAVGSQPPIQRQALEEDKEVQMMADFSRTGRAGTEAQPAVKAGILAMVKAAGDGAEG